MPDLTAMTEAATAEARSEILAAIQLIGQSTAEGPVGHGEIRLRGADPAPADIEAHPGVAAEDPPSAATGDAPAAAAEDAQAAATEDAQAAAAEDAPGEPVGDAADDAATAESESVGHGRIRLR